MKSIEDLRIYAEKYDIESDFPFCESAVVESLNLSRVDSALNSLPLAFCNEKLRGRRVDSSACGRTSGDSAAPVSPATNRGAVKYRETFGGYDGGIEAGFYGEWEPSRFSDLAAKLDTCKQAANDKNLSESFIDLGGFVWRVSPMGARCGALAYKWAIEHHGLQVFVHSGAKGDIAPVRCRIGAQCLYKVDLFTCVKTLKSVLEAIGFDLSYEIVSRVDMQVMLPIDISDFIAELKPGRIVTECRGDMCNYVDLSTGKINSITLKSTTTELCVYDKIEQVLKMDSVGFGLFQRWVLEGDDFPPALTRFEFRFRRESLRRYGINTFDDLKKSQLSLIQIAYTDWFRVLKEDKVRGHESGQEVSAVWREVQNAFDYYFSDFRISRRPAGKLKDFQPVKKPPKIALMIKQAEGILASVCAYIMPKIETVSDVYKKACAILSDDVGRLYDSCVTKHIYNGVSRGQNDYYNSAEDVSDALHLRSAAVANPSFY